jgi:hypothetical protein
MGRWADVLNTVSDVLDEWVKVQRVWLYLQPIFDSPDIQKQLPTECVPTVPHPHTHPPHHPLPPASSLGTSAPTGYALVSCRGL